jgi:hypothetical protein
MLQTADILESQAAILATDAPQSGTQSSTATQSAKTQLDAKVAAARIGAARLENEPGHDGMRQLAARAQEEEHRRDHALHLHEGFERSVRALQIAIVLVGLFMATRLFWLLGVGATLGAVGLLYGIAVGFGMA